MEDYFNIGKAVRRSFNQFKESGHVEKGESPDNSGRQVRMLRKSTATLDPEPTQHTKPIFVWAYIARHVCLL
jgi:hypothetical protein